VIGDASTAATAILKETETTFAKRPDHFKGIAKTVSFFDEGRAAENTSEIKEVVTPVMGKPFTVYGEDYIAVAVVVGGLRAVKVSNGKWWKFGNSGKDAVDFARRFNLI